MRAAKQPADHVATLVVERLRPPAGILGEQDVADAGALPTA
jgi:hypothetical protein